MNARIRTLVGVAFCFLLSAFCLAGCGRDSDAAGETTETIAPAAPQPAATGTEALTETVDVEDSRSDAEGGGLSSPPAQQTATSGTATPATAESTATR